MRHRRPWKSPAFRLLAAMLCGVGAAALWLAPMAGLLLLTSVPEWLLQWLGHAAWMCGGFCAGRCTGFHARRHGLGNGLAAGAGLCGLLLAICFGMKGNLTAAVSLRCLLVLATAAAGGIAGVNQKLRRAPF